MEINISTIDGNGNYVQQGTTEKTCETCKYYESNNKFNGNCRRLSMSVLKPQPQKFVVRNEFYCNLYE